jgi:hypothetical protein
MQQYAASIGRLSKLLCEDLPHFKPIAGAYSPYGVIFGFSSNLTEHMALKTVQSDAATHFSVEDVFADESASADKLAWVSGWRKLPHIKQEVQRLFDYPQQFAEEIFARIEQALRRRVADGANASVKTGRLFIVRRNDPQAGSKALQIAQLQARYIQSSDMQIVAANEAHSVDETSLLHDRQEGMFVVSYRTSRGWTAISKDILTEVLGAGRDVKIVALPNTATEVLRLMCPMIPQP